jgi:hypothetical protein
MKGLQSFRSALKPLDKNEKHDAEAAIISHAKVHFDCYIVSDVWEAPKAYDRRMSEDTLLRLVQMSERRKAQGVIKSSPTKKSHTDKGFGESEEAPPTQLVMSTA